MANSSASKGWVARMSKDNVTRHGAINERAHVSVQQDQCPPAQQMTTKGDPASAVLRFFKRSQKCGFLGNSSGFINNGPKLNSFLFKHWEDQAKHDVGGQFVIFRQGQIYSGSGHRSNL